MCKVGIRPGAVDHLCNEQVAMISIAAGEGDTDTRFLWLARCQASGDDLERAGLDQGLDRKHRLRGSSVSVSLPVRAEMTEKDAALRVIKPSPQRLGVVADRCHDLAPIDTLFSGSSYLSAQFAEEAAGGGWPVVDASPGG